MKRKIVGISIFCLVLGSLFYMSYTKKNSMPDYMSYLPAEDSVLQNIASENRQIQDFIKSDFTWRAAIILRKKMLGMATLRATTSRQPVLTSASSCSSATPDKS